MLNFNFDHLKTVNFTNPIHMFWYDNNSVTFLIAEESIGGLTDVKAKKNSARSRLEKKILNKLAIFLIYTILYCSVNHRKSLKRVAEAMDKINEKRYQQKYSSSFKYALSKWLCHCCGGGDVSWGWDCSKTSSYVVNYCIPCRLWLNIFMTVLLIFYRIQI